MTVLGLDRPDGALAEWGPRIRLACSHRRFRQFETALAPTLRAGPAWIGSGDFHHVSLALLRRINMPFNLLVLDLHPDWVRGVPFMHCGTWLAHALRLPNLHRVFHVGGDMDFDNRFRHFAPWKELRSGRVAVLPARRRYTVGRWREIDHQPLSRSDDHPLPQGERAREMLESHRAELAARPLYISLDKDVMVAADAVTNWESGFLELADVCAILTTFIGAANGRLAGMDVTGDWSPVEASGLLRKWLDRTEHPRQIVDPIQATAVNERTNAALLAHLDKLNITWQTP